MGFIFEPGDSDLLHQELWDRGSYRHDKQFADHQIVQDPRQVTDPSQVRVGGIYQIVYRGNRGAVFPQEIFKVTQVGGINFVTGEPHNNGFSVDIRDPETGEFGRSTANPWFSMLGLCPMSGKEGVGRKGQWHFGEFMVPLAEKDIPEQKPRDYEFAC